MPQRIDIPGQGIVEFPDSMSDAQILAVIHANTKTATSEPGQIPKNAQFDIAPDAVERPTTFAKIGRQLGLTARAGINAATAIPAMMADAYTGVVNQFLPEGRKFKSQQPLLNELLTKWGIPEPGNSAERVVGDVTGAIGGVGAAANAAGKAGPMLAPFAEKVGQQILAAGAGSAASSATRERGGGPGAQMLAAVLAGLAPTATMAAWRMAAPNTTQAGRFDTKGRLLNDAAGSQRKEVLAGLDDNRSFVPGEQPTAAQAASSGNAPAFAAVEKMVVEKMRPDLAAVRAMENKAARLAAVQSIGKDKTALDAAIGAREAAAGPLYKQAESGVMPVGKAFNRLKARPQFKTALEIAERHAKDDGIDDLFFRDTKGRPIAMLGSGVHYIKKALDETGSFSSPHYLDKHAASSAIKTRDEFLKLADEFIPEYGQAKAAFAAKSPPVNQMVIGQGLARKLSAPLPASGERAASFAQAVDDAPKTITRELSGSPRFETFQQAGLTDKQVGLLGNVQDSLNRRALTNSQATLGAQNARGLLGAEFKSTDVPNWLSVAMTLTRYALEHVGVKTMHKTLNELAKDLQDPTIAAKLMREANPSRLAAMKTVLDAASKPAMAGLLQPATQLED